MTTRQRPAAEDVETRGNEADDDEVDGDFAAAMYGNEIPAHAWVEFFDDFSRRHSGEVVCVEAGAADADSDVEEYGEIVAREMPLGGITAETGPGHEGTIQILVGTEPDDSLTHVVAEPAEVWLYQANGLDEVVEINAVNGVTRVTFC